MDVPAFVVTELEQLGVTLDEQTLAKLAQYLSLLLEKNRQFNLTGIKEPEQAWRRHIIDSLTIVPLIEPVEAGQTLVDVGTGGGLPGIPLAIVMPHVQVTLVEATGKKARFLEEAREVLKLENVHVVNQRAEQVGQDSQFRQKFDLATCRAVGPMTELLEFTMPLLSLGGMLLAMKGPSVEKELADCGDALDILGAGDVKVVEAYPEEMGQETVVVMVEKERMTPPKYPRAAGMARQSPL